MEDREVISEFLVESNENLGRLDQEMVELEQRPKDAKLLASIFRTIHTIKGTCGFLGFSNIERITHHAETILSQVREDKRELTQGIVSLVLETVDAVKAELEVIETTMAESGNAYEALGKRPEAAASDLGSAAEQLAAAEQPAAAEQTASAATTLEKPTASQGSSASPVAEAKAVQTKPATEAQAAPASQPASQPATQPAAAPKPAAEQPKAEKKAATKPTEAATEANASKGASITESSIRVDIGVLDRLMNLVGELVLARNQVLQFPNRMGDANFDATTQRLNLITSELQESVMKTRMQPIGTVWNKLPRIVRDVTSLLNKQINLEMEGAETELDRTVIETIKDPLTHIVRNACDHGVESPEIRIARGKPAAGTLTLRAFHEGGSVNIEISDDGGGIDPQRVKNKAIEKGLLRPEQAERMSDRELTQLIFLPGFSTASQVTNISGRGVGMDVVKTNVEKIGGSVDVVSVMGEGATVRVKLPLTLAIVPGLLVSSSSLRFVIPQVNLVELLRLEADELQSRVQWVQDAPVFRRRGQLLPLVFLNRVLQLDGPNRGSVSLAASPLARNGQINAEGLNIAVLQAESHQFGVVVDGVHDTQEIVVKPLNPMLKSLTTYAGATIMGDGTVALILDVAGLARAAGIKTSSLNNRVGEDAKETRNSGEKQSFLVFQAGSYLRLAVPLSIVARLEELAPDRFEYASGRPVVQYRDRILQIIHLQEMLGGGFAQTEAAEGSGTNAVPVIVFTRGDRWIGLQVDQIVDIVDAVPEMTEASRHQHIHGSAVLDGVVTDFLDLPSIISSVDPTWLEEDSAAMVDIHQVGKTNKDRKRKRTVLLADPSAFDRGTMRAVLEIAGYQVMESADLHAARKTLAAETIDATLTSLEWPESDLLQFLADTENYPIVGLAKAGQNISDDVHPKLSAIFDRQDRNSMIIDLGRLLKSMQSEQAAAPAQQLELVQ